MALKPSSIVTLLTRLSKEKNNTIQLNGFILRRYRCVSSRHAACTVYERHKLENVHILINHEAISIAHRINIQMALVFCLLVAFFRVHHFKQYYPLRY